MKTPLFCSTRDVNTVNSAARYRAFVDLHNSPGWRSADDRAHPAPIDGSIENIYVVLSGAPGDGTSYDVELLVNGSSAGSVNIAGSATTGSIAGPIAVTAGDLLSWKVTPNSSPTARGVSLACVYDAAEAVMFGGDTSALVAGTTHRHCPLVPHTRSDGAIGAQIVMPTSGTFTRIFVKLTDAVTGSDSVEVHVENQSGTSGPAVNITSGSTGNDTSTTLAFSAADLIHVEILKTNAGGTVSGALWGVAFDPTTDGESVTAAVLTSWAKTLTRYSRPGFRAGDASTDPATTRRIAAVGFTVKNPRLDAAAAVGAGNSYTFELLVGGASVSTFDLTIADTTPTASDTDSYDVAQYDELSIKGTPAGSPTGGGGVVLSWVNYIAPAAGGGSLLPRLMAEGLYVRSAA